MKISKKTTKVAPWLIVAGAVIFIAYFYIMLEPVQAHYANVAYPDLLWTIIVSTVTGALIGSLFFMGYWLSNVRDSLGDGQVENVSLKQIVTYKGFLAMVICIAVFFLGATLWWRSEL